MKPIISSCRGIWGALVIFACASTTCSAEEVPPAILNQLNTFVQQKSVTFAGLRSFEMKGMIVVTVADEYLKMNPGAKVLTTRFQIQGDGGAIKEVEESLGDKGEVVHTTTYHLDSQRIVEIDAGTGFAKIFKLGPPNIGLYNVCPAFFEYAFLGMAIDGAGIPALLPSDLASKDKWAGVLRGLRGASMAKDGSLHATFGTSQGSSSVDFGVPRAGDSLRVSSVSFFDRDGRLDRKLEITDFARDKKFGEIGRNMRVSVYRSTPGAPPTAVWEFRIDEIKLNPSLDEGAMAFDPASANIIWDAENKTYIRVPK